jgi:hypothetical protein
MAFGGALPYLDKSIARRYNEVTVCPCSSGLSIGNTR